MSNLARKMTRSQNRGSWKVDLKGKAPESWLCVDCGVNTAPGCLNRLEMEAAFLALKPWEKRQVEQSITSGSEVYTVRHAVWKASGMKPDGGCLCVGCLEQRLGRKLMPEDFPDDYSFNSPTMPGTERLLSRRRGMEVVFRQNHVRLRELGLDAGVGA
jgi:hypothetical protein